MGGLFVIQDGEGLPSEEPSWKVNEETCRLSRNHPCTGIKKVLLKGIYHGQKGYFERKSERSCKRICSSRQAKPESTLGTQRDLLKRHSSLSLNRTSLYIQLQLYIKMLLLQHANTAYRSITACIPRVT